MLECWSAEKEKRPTFSRLKLKLKVIAIKYMRETVKETEEEIDEYVTIS